MLKDFYVAFAPVSFTLLGLWLIVVQTRHADWRREPALRRRAYGVSLHFALPGLMSLLSLVDPNSTSLWRAGFAAVATAGVGVFAALGARRAARGEAALYATAIVFYALVALVAIAPGLVGDVGIELRAIRLEAILLSLVVFIGVNVVWLLMFDEAAPSEATGAGRATGRTPAHDVPAPPSPTEDADARATPTRP